MDLENARFELIVAQANYIIELEKKAQSLAKDSMYWYQEHKKLKNELANGSPKAE